MQWKQPQDFELVGISCPEGTAEDREMDTDKECEQHFFKAEI